MPSSSPRVVLITHPVEGASDFARSLVDAGLAACVNLLPVRSVFRWQGEIEEEAEVMLVAKTTEPRLAELEARLADLHPYDVPECIALAPDRVETQYLEWLGAETRRAK